MVKMQLAETKSFDVHLPRSAAQRGTGVKLNPDVIIQQKKKNTVILKWCYNDSPPSLTFSPERSLYARYSYVYC